MPHSHRPGVRRRQFLQSLCLSAAMAVGASASAETAGAAPPYPDKPVRLIVNFPAGGPIDILGRTLAVSLQAQLGQPFVVENRPGAGGGIGAEAVAKSPADGYTVLLSIDTTFTINPHLYATSGYRPQDLRPLMIFSSSGLTFAVAPSVQAATLPAFVDMGESRKWFFGSGGNGSPGHFAAEIFRATTGDEIMHVPYKGNTGAVLALMSGEIEAGILATPGVLPQIQAGKLRALAVTSAQRSPLMPDIPTVAELGLPDLSFEVFYLAMVPAAVPEPVVQTLQQAMRHALAQPEVKARLAMLDMVAVGEVGQGAARRIEASRTRYGRIVESTGMKID